MHWGLRQIKKKKYFRGFDPLKPLVRGELNPHTRHRGFHHQTPDKFGFNPPSNLVIGYHWLAFLNQVHKILASPQFTTNVEYKIDHISKTKNRASFMQIFEISEGVKMVKSAGH